MMPTPDFFSPRIISKRLMTSLSVMDEVGSSMMTTRAFCEIALAISTICWSATRSRFILVLGFNWIPSSFSSSSVCL